MNITDDMKRNSIASSKVLIDSDYEYDRDRDFIEQVKFGGNGNNNNDDNDDENRRKRRKPPINTCIIDSDKVSRLFYKYSVSEDDNDKYRLMGIFPDVESCIKYLDTGIGDNKGQSIIIDKGIVNKIDSIIVYINTSIENDIGDIGMIKKRYPSIDTIVFTCGKDERVYG